MLCEDSGGQTDSLPRPDVFKLAKRSWGVADADTQKIGQQPQTKGEKMKEMMKKKEKNLGGFGEPDVHGARKVLEVWGTVWSKIFCISI